MIETNRGTDGGIDFRKLPDIEKLPPPYQVQLLSQARVQRCVDGQTLFHTGDEDDFALYLLEGMVILLGNDGSVVEIRGREPASRLALDPEQPRRCTARAVGSATLLTVKRSLLEKLTALASQSDTIGGLAETTNNDSGNWMTRIARAPIFTKLPSGHLLQLFERGTLINVISRELVAAQGNSAGDFYVVQDGVFRMERSQSGTLGMIEMAELRSGDSFGAEALLTGEPLNFAVTAVTAGALVRITRADFLELIVEPLVQAVALRQAGELVRSHRARWLDVRPQRLAADIKGEQALHIPLDDLRMRLGRLPRQMPYIVTSDSSAFSRAGVFVLLDAGYDARYLNDLAAVSPAHEQESVAAAPDAPAHALLPRQEESSSADGSSLATGKPAYEAEDPQPQASTPTATTTPMSAPPLPSTPLPLPSTPTPTPASTPTPHSGTAAANPFASVGMRIHREIDAQMRTLKEHVDRELAEQARLLDQSALEQQRRTMEIETQYQQMARRREEVLRKAYERVLGLASSMQHQFDELQQMHSHFDRLLGDGSSAIPSSAQPSAYEAPAASSDANE